MYMHGMWYPCTYTCTCKSGVRANEQSKVSFQVGHPLQGPLFAFWAYNWSGTCRFPCLHELESQIDSSGTLNFQLMQEVPHTCYQGSVCTCCLGTHADKETKGRKYVKRTDVYIWPFFEGTPNRLMHHMHYQGHMCAVVQTHTCRQRSKNYVVQTFLQSN